jgi:hypothetical protein
MESTDQIKCLTKLIDLTDLKEIRAAAIITNNRSGYLSNLCKNGLVESASHFCQVGRHPDGQY